MRDGTITDATDLSGSSSSNLLRTYRRTCVGYIRISDVVKVSRNDKGSYEKDYPYEAVQVWPLSRYPGCPFQIDRTFRKAFRNAVRKFGANRIRKARTANVPSALIELIAAEYGIVDEADE